MHARWDPCATKWQVRGAEPRREGDGCLELRRAGRHATVLYLGNACIIWGRSMRMDVSRGTPSGDRACIIFILVSLSQKYSGIVAAARRNKAYRLSRKLSGPSRPRSQMAMRLTCDRSCAWYARSRSAAAPFPFRQAFNSFARSSFGVLVSAPVPATGKEGIGGSCRRGRSDRGASP